MVRQCELLMTMAFAVVACTFPGAAVAAPGVSWSATQQIDPASNAELNQVSCSTSALCVAVDNQGQALTTASPSAHPWRAIDADPRQFVSALGCVPGSASLCVLGDGIWNVITSTTPLIGPYGVYTGSENNGLSHVTAIACPSTTFCVAASSRGDLLINTNPTGPWPQATSTDGGYIDAVSCVAGTTFCATFDDSGDILTTNSPANAIDAPGARGSWSVSTVDTPPPTSFVFGGGVSCPSRSLCVAVDESGNILTSTNPTAGAGAQWQTASDVHGNGDLVSVSCAPSSTFCVAVGGKDALWSADPAAGASSWTLATVDPAGGLASVSCPTTKLCVAVDQTGHGLVATATGPPAVAGGVVIKSAKVTGTRCKLSIAAPGAGKLSVSGTGVSGSQESVRATGTISVTVKLAHSGLTALHAHHQKLRVTLTVLFKPARGTASRATAAVTFT